jgi:hypothetical protein
MRIDAIPEGLDDGDHAGAQAKLLHDGGHEFANGEPGEAGQLGPQHLRVVKTYFSAKSSVAKLVLVLLEVTVPAPQLRRHGRGPARGYDRVLLWGREHDYLGLLRDVSSR